MLTMIRQRRSLALLSRCSWAAFVSASLTVLLGFSDLHCAHGPHCARNGGHGRPLLHADRYHDSDADDRLVPDSPRPSCRLRARTVATVGGMASAVAMTGFDRSLAVRV